MPTEASTLREQILELTGQFYGSRWPGRSFVAGRDYVPVSGKVFDGEELINLVDASLDFHLTAGRYTAEFESRFSQIMGKKSIHYWSIPALVRICLPSQHLPRRCSVNGGCGRAMR
ncbi:hypothetical protein ACFTAO_33075 [Paenibacillus rhizoplanae]